MPSLEWFQHPYTITLIRWGLAVMFLASAAGKLLDRDRFIEIVLAYEVLPKRLAVIFAALLPWLEAATGAMLLLGLATKLGAILSGVLLLSFSIAVGINLARGRTELDCGCFGSQQGQKISYKILVRDVALIGLSLQVTLFVDGYFALDGWLFGTRELGKEPPSVEGLLIFTLMSLGLLMLYWLASQTITFARHDRS